MTIIRSQSVSRDNDRPPLRRLEVFDGSHVPSWRSNTPGSARLDCLGHEEAKWVQLHLEEWYEGANRSVTKAAMLTLDERAARALLDFLNDVLVDARPAALKRLADAADTFASSDPNMPSHADTAAEFEVALGEARAAIAKAEGSG